MLKVEHCRLFQRCNLWLYPRCKDNFVMSSLLLGCVFTLSFALIAAADLNASVPMILIGRIIGGLAVGYSNICQIINNQEI